MTPWLVLYKSMIGQNVAHDPCGTWLTEDNHNEWRTWHLSKDRLPFAPILSAASRTSWSSVARSPPYS
jgi:hypothetical protein